MLFLQAKVTTNKANKCFHMLLFKEMAELTHTHVWLLDELDVLDVLVLDVIKITCQLNRSEL